MTSVKERDSYSNEPLFPLNGKRENNCGKIWKKNQVEQEENYSIALCHFPSCFAAHRIDFLGSGALRWYVRFSEGAFLLK